MIVLGSSLVSGQIGVSSGMAALSAWSYFEEEKKVLLIQAGFGNNLEETLLGMKKRKKEGFFETKGIDALVRLESAGMYEDSALEHSIVTLHCGNGKFHLPTSTTKVNEELYEKDLIQWLPSIVEHCKRQYDHIFIDIGWQQRRLLEQLEEIADRSLYFIPQNRWILEEIEQRDWKENQSVVLTKYMEESFFNERNIKVLFSKIGRCMIGNIPFQYQYMDSWSKGNAMKYLAIQCDMKEQRLDCFWNQVGKVIQRMQKGEERGKGYPMAL